METDPFSATPNENVDYVIQFRFAGPGIDTDRAENQLSQLLRALDSVGLRTEIRDNDDTSLFVFVRVKSYRKFVAEVYRSRIKDWLHGIRPAAPEKETQKSLEREPVTEAERLRLVYHLITLPIGQGGAGITPKIGDYTLVDQIFALHDRKFNAQWLKKWSTTWKISPEELTNLRNRFGERVAFYFAFLQTYLVFLAFPCIAGTSAAFLLPAYSKFFAVVNILWAVVFLEYWKRQEVDLAVAWGVRGCSKLNNIRAAFQYERIEVDPVTGEKIKVFPEWKRMVRQSLIVPFALAASGTLCAFIACVFAIEVFISEVYNGPFKSVLVFLPTVLLSAINPILLGFFTTIAKRLTDYENHSIDEAYEAAFTRKVFVLNFITSYTGLFLTSFIYVPFAKVIVPHLDILGLTAKELTDEKQTHYHSFEINPNRLKNQVIYFTVTAQAVNLGLEIVLPYVKRSVFKKFEEFKVSAPSSPALVDSEAEKKFIKRVRDESKLEVYDVTTDLREMVMQFGYLTLFSIIWPFASVSFIINNWVELRADAIKICVEMQRPVPLRADSIGPWLDSLQFLAWLGSATTSALIYLFSDDANFGPAGTPKPLTIAGVMTAIVLSEHIFFGARMLVGIVFSAIESVGVLKERRERFLVRKRYLEESMGIEADDIDTDVVTLGDSVKDVSGKSGFWRAANVAETYGTGAEIIRGKLEKKKQ